MISILNVYGKKNIGDSTINNVAIKLLNSLASPNDKFAIQCIEPDQYSLPFKTKFPVIPIASPYGYAIQKSKGGPLDWLIKPYTATVIVVTSLIYSFAGKFSDILLPTRGFYSYIKYIKSSELVINMGGGYLRTKAKYKDLFGLILTLLPIIVAKLYRKQIVFLPMSFGNFENSFHKQLAFLAIKNTVFMSRDDVTYKSVCRTDRRHKVTNVFSPDLAFYYQWDESINMERKQASDYVVLTCRKWLPVNEQNELEMNLASFIDYLWKNKKLKTKFIPMAYNYNEDDDNVVANDIRGYILDKKSLEIPHVTTPEDTQDVLRGARFAICTRMHSAILACTVFTPFIAIEYEHKMKGLVQLIGISQYHLHIKDVTFDKLESKVNQLLSQKDYDKYISVLKEYQKSLSLYKVELLNHLKKLYYEKKNRY